MIRFDDMVGRSAVVTGCSQGIGRATCELLLEQGVRVFGVARTAADDLRHERFTFLGCDLSDAQAITATVARVREQSDSLDYLVNVAGIDPKFSLEEGDESKWEEVVNLNLRAYYLLIRACYPLLRAGCGKAIVNTSSINYRLGVPKRAIYSTTKAGILGLTTGLARELGAHGIRINTVTPGWTFTDRQIREYFADPETSPKYLSYLQERQSLRLQITPRDIAYHIAFYLSDAARASTGHNCVVDGGWLLE